MHTPPSRTHTSSLQSVTFLYREDTCMMRSHTRPWGQCLLCMSRFILEGPGVQFAETREPGRGPAFVSDWPRGGRGVRGRWGRELHCTAEAWTICTVGSQAGVLALNLALLQTSLPWRSAVPTAKTEHGGKKCFEQHTCPHC